MSKRREISKLGLSLEDRAYVIPRAKLNFTLFYSVMGRQLWSPLRYDNGLVCYGNSEHLDLFLYRFTNQPNTWRQYCEINLYSSYEVTDFKDTKLFTKYVLKGSLESTLDSFIAERKIVRDEMKRNGDMESQKKVSIIFLHASPQELSELNTKPNVLRKFLDLYEDSSDERMFFFLLAQYVQNVSSDIRSIFEWSAMLGEENIDFCRKKFAGRLEKKYNVDRELVGMITDATSDKVLPVHDIAYDPSDYKIERKGVEKMEETAFQELLDSI